MRRLIGLSALCLCIAAALAAEPGKWSQTFGDDKFWTKEDARFVPKDNPDRAFTYSALRFDRTSYSYELMDMEKLLEDSFPDQSDDGLVFDPATGKYRVLQANVGEAWDILKEDSNVVAIIPMGFAASAGDPRIVGYRKINGKTYRGIFEANNLDTLLCLDDAGDERKARYPYQIPLIIGLDFTERSTFRYADDLSAINLGFEDDEDYYQGRLQQCTDVVQVGPRVIQPRDYTPEGWPNGRLAVDINSVAASKPTESVVLLYDWNGWVNFVRTSDPSTTYDIGTLVSSDAFYDKVKDDPKRCEWGPRRPSLSCELWAVTVSAFDSAAIAVRTQDGVSFWGKPDNFTPGVLIIRRMRARVEPAIPSSNNTDNTGE